MNNDLFEFHKHYDAIKARSKYPYAQRFLKEVYPYYFDRKRRQSIKILEIGVYNGGSLEAMRDYFPNAQLTGIDIINKVNENIKSWDRISFFQGDQSDKNFLKYVGKTAGPFDFIIEDGSHNYNDQVISFETLFPYLTSDGVYFVEDVIDVWNGQEIIKYFHSLIPYSYPIPFEKQVIENISFYQGIIAISKIVRE